MRRQLLIPGTLAHLYHVHRRVEIIDAFYLGTPERTLHKFNDRVSLSSAGVASLRPRRDPISDLLALVADAQVPAGIADRRAADRNLDHFSSLGLRCRSRRQYERLLA